MAVYLVTHGTASQLDDGFSSVLSERIADYGTEWVLVEACSAREALGAGAAHDRDEARGMVLDQAGASAKLAWLGIEVQS